MKKNKKIINLFISVMIVSVLIIIILITNNQIYMNNVSKLGIKTHNQQNNVVIKYFEKSNNIHNIYTKYKCKSNKCILPNKYITKLTGNINLYQYNTSNGNKSFITITKGSDINYYLVPNNTYYLESKSNPNKYEIVKITGNLRVISGSLGNFRDLGGWMADGGRIKYGIIYRSAASDKLSQKMVDILKIGRIIDLRGKGEISTKATSASKNIRKVISIKQYSADKKSKVRNAVTAVMKAVVEENKNVLFNCVLGRDRTGTVAYLIEGILGVSKANRYRDYELTYFSKPERTRTYGAFQSLVIQLNKYKKIKHEQEKFINWYLSGSSNKNKDLELINNFRKKMINGNPQKYKLSGGKLALA